MANLRGLECVFPQQCLSQSGLGAVPVLIPGGLTCSYRTVLDATWAYFVNRAIKIYNYIYIYMCYKNIYRYI